jgi:hypothetical protein
MDADALRHADSVTGRRATGFGKKHLIYAESAL